LLDLDDVTRDKQFSVNDIPFSIAEHSGLGGLHLLEGIKGAVSVAVLPDGDTGVEYEDKKDNEGLDVCGHTLLTITYIHKLGSHAHCSTDLSSVYCEKTNIIVSNPK